MADIHLQKNNFKEKLLGDISEQQKPCNKKYLVYELTLKNKFKTCLDNRYSLLSSIRSHSLMIKAFNTLLYDIVLYACVLCISLC